MGRERFQKTGLKPAWSVFPELEPVEGISTPSIQVKTRKRARSQKVDHSTAATQNIKATTISFSTIHQYGELYINFLKARKKTFIDQLGWNLPQTEGMEFDQYDTPQCRWVVIHEFGEVLGGVRLSPTTASCGVYSYMLRDAQKGILENIPSDVLFFDAPVDERTWEASRLFLASDLPAQRRQSVQAVLMDALSQSAREQGAVSVIGIVPYVWSRWLRRLNLSAVAVGPKFSIDGTTSQAALFNIGAKLH
ncbi:acyl-homoserine-lactone synthase [Aliiroseovarius subalbicans]|uniref:acyl-homoserine-lactone synthase n=1 Tax=Aliiroseovarius subalbicans TaxID=2925840 RepID=UPI001F5661B2|nr:acyl-homoserine-lactone synthase [Aliiroseovarius subalbicans]MCI2399239.1 N-acyl-L-homoserine lactone synthetase [Aliiroseovarius subalbicans]